MATVIVNEAERGEIMTPVLHSGLPHATLCGPKCLQGFGVIHPWCHQEITHLMACLKRTLIGSMTGSLISASLEQLRLELGLPGWWADHDFSKFGQLAADSWIKTAWQFASRFHIKLRDSKAQNDLFLMTEFGRLFHGNDLLALDICRTFLHLVTLADICTVKGETITRHAWQGQ